MKLDANPFQTLQLSSSSASGQSIQRLPHHHSSSHLDLRYESHSPIVLLWHSNPLNPRDFDSSPAISTDHTHLSSARSSSLKEGKRSKNIFGGLPHALCARTPAAQLIPKREKTESLNRKTTRANPNLRKILGVQSPPSIQTHTELNSAHIKPALKLNARV